MLRRPPCWQPNTGMWPVAGSPGTQSVDLAALGPQELRRVAQQLQASLQARELQLERKGQELADMQHVQDQIMVSLQLCLRGRRLWRGATGAEHAAWWCELRVSSCGCQEWPTGLQCCVSGHVGPSRWSWGVMRGRCRSWNQAAACTVLFLAQQLQCAKPRQSSLHLRTTEVCPGCAGSQ